MRKLNSERQSLSLRSSFIQMAVGNGIYSVCQWAMVAVLAKNGSAATVGIFAFALALTSPVFLLSNLSLRSVLVTDVQSKYHFFDYYVLRILTNCVAVLALVCIIVSARYDLVTNIVIGMMTLARIGDAISDIIYGLLQTCERIGRIAISRSAQGILQLFVLSIIILVTRNIILAVAGMASASLLITGLYDLRSNSYKSAALDAKTKAKTTHNSISTPTNALSILARPLHAFRHFRREPYVLLNLIKISLPLGVVACLDVLLISIPRYYIEHFYGKTNLGYFSAVAYLMIFGGTITGALAETARPRLAQNFASSPTLFLKLLIKLMCIGATIGIVGVAIAMFFGQQLLTILYRGDYAKHVDLLIWVMVAALAWHLSTFCSTAAVATRSFLNLMFLLMINMCSMVLICHLIIPKYGLVGAGWALCVGMSIRLVGSCVIVGYALIKRTFAADKPSLKIMNHGETK